MRKRLDRSVRSRQTYELALADRAANKPREIRLFRGELRRLRRLQRQLQACLRRLAVELRMPPSHFAQLEATVETEVRDHIAMQDPREPWPYEVRNRAPEPWLEPFVRYVAHAIRRKRLSNGRQIKLVHEALKLVGHGDVVTPEKIRYALEVPARSQQKK
jgi:hypothetical protein